jgi:uncharacterized protein (DUF486 family)
MDQNKVFLFISGILIVLYGIKLWFNEDNKGNVLNINIIKSIIIIFIGAYLLLTNIYYIFELMGLKKTIYNPNMVYNKYIIFLFIYIGSVFYTIASYYHLKETNWSFLKALLIAVPVVFIEYQFTLRGNHQLSTLYGFNSTQIGIFVIISDFINAWLLSYFILKQKNNNSMRNILAFFFIYCAYKSIDYNK